MEKLDKKTEAHLFICCRTREGKDCCSQKGSEQMVQELKKWTKEKGIKDQIKVSKSSCLGHCENGITACLYPQNQWFVGITTEDTDKIKEMLEEYAK